MSYIKRLFQFRLAVPVILLVIGLPLLCITAFDPWQLEISSPHWYKFLGKCTDVVLVSSLISFLLDSAEYMGVFKKDLEEIIYDTKYLEKRNDIENIWVKVSKVFTKMRFPQISTPLMNAVKDFYTPDDDLKLSYYSDYRNIYTVTYDKNDPNFINVKNETTFTLKVEDTKKFDFPMRYWNCVAENEQDAVSIDFKKITINGEPANVTPLEKSYRDGMVCQTFKLELEGKTEYQICQENNQRYDLRQDNYLGFRARWLVNDMRIQIFHPADLKLLFVNRATANGFRTNKETLDFSEYEYKGLILKNQGYIIILNKQPSTMKLKRIEGDMEV